MHTIIKQRRSLLPLPRPPGSWDRFGGNHSGVIGRFLDILLTWQERAAQRWALRQLDDHLLKDIGLSRADAAREAGKPFWLG